MGELNCWASSPTLAGPALPDDCCSPKKVCPGLSVYGFIDLVHTKARLDDDLQAMVSLLEQKYPFDTCTDHPRKHCFHYWVMNKHFDLTHPQLLVWVAAIVGVSLLVGLLLHSHYTYRDGKRQQSSGFQLLQISSRMYMPWTCREGLPLLHL